jgi:2,4-dienoyl-CoA reductase (NADPH2)
MSGHGMLLADQLVSDAHIAYAATRARGGAALVGLQSEPVHKTGHHYGERHIALYLDEAVPGLARLADAVHEAGSKVFQILWHAGHNVPYREGVPAWAPSAVPSPVLGEVPKAMTRAEIREVVAAYGAAARRCREAGFDAVEVQTASDYLLGSFLSPATNRRTDAYGGTADNRRRIVVEVLEAVRAAAGPGMAVAVRTGADWMIPTAPHAWGPDEAIEAMGGLVERGLVDWISVTVGSHYAMDRIIPPMNVPRGNAVEAAGRLKAALDIPIMVAGRIRTPAEAERVLAEGKADVIAMARTWIADPDWMAKVQRGDEERVRPCVSCNQGCIGTVIRGAHGTCVVNPVAGNETRLGALEPAAPRKRVAVVGGGPAGLEAARTAAERGHSVTLYEAAAQLGGEWLLAGKAPHRGELLEAIAWWERELAALGVAVQLGRRVDDPSALEADAVVLATGGRPSQTAVWRFRPTLVDGIPGTDGLPHGREVLNGERRASGSVLVIDEEGGWQAVSLAETLAADPAVTSVTVVTTLPGLGAPELMYSLELGPVTQRIRAAGIVVRTEALVERVDGGRAQLLDGELLGPFDTIVLSTGAAAPELPDAVATLRAPYSEEHPPQGTPPVWAIGDAVAPRGFWAATSDGNRIARLL